MNKLKAARFLLGLTQWDLSSVAKINPSKISLIETGRINPSNEEKSRLATALSRRPEEVFPDN